MRLSQRHLCGWRGLQLHVEDALAHDPHKARGQARKSDLALGTVDKLAGAKVVARTVGAQCLLVAVDLWNAGRVRPRLDDVERFEHFAALFGQDFASADLGQLG
eukprot:3024018-Prymnesium_polylepis.1